MPTARDILGRRAGQEFDERLQTVRGSYRFDIGGFGSYRIDVDYGRVQVREDRQKRPADCVVACSEPDFVGIATGELNLLTAYMRAQVRIEGDLALAKALHGIMPPRGAGQEAQAP